MGDVNPTRSELETWPDEARARHARLAQAQYDAYERLDRTLRRLTPRQHRKAIQSLLAFGDARDELLWLNGSMVGVSAMQDRNRELKTG